MNEKKLNGIKGEIMKKYNRQEIVDKIEIANKDMNTFYKQDFINYRGITKDTNEPYTEIIAEYLLNHLDLFDQIRMIVRVSDYRSKSHDGTTPNHNSNRIEERIAMSMYGKDYAHIGKVLDYQVPLKNIKDDSAGKVDLIAYKAVILRLLELKRPDSKETLLRCVLEGETYLRTVDQKKMISDFGLVRIQEEIRVKASPLVFYDQYQHEEYKMQLPKMIALMRKLDSQVFLIKKQEVITKSIRHEDKINRGKNRM